MPTQSQNDLPSAGPQKLLGFVPVGSLKTRLRWSYALVSVTPLLLLGLLLIAASFRTQRENIIADQQIGADWVARQLRDTLSATDERLLKLGLYMGPNQTQVDMLRATSELLQTAPEILDIAVLDPEGKERVHISQLRVYHDAELIDRSDDPLVRWTIETGRVARGTIVRQPNGMLVYTSHAPILDNAGRVTGSIRVEADATNIERILREAPLMNGSSAYLVDRQGALQLAGNPITVRETPGELAMLLGRDDEVHEYTRSGEVVIGAWTRVPVQPEHWWVVVEIPRDLAFEPVQRDSRFLMMAVGLVIVTTIGWGIYQSRNILRPLQELRAGAATIGAGNLSSRIDASGTDEIGELAQEFNRMAEHLEESRAEVERQNEHLRHGLTLARDIQLGLLPKFPPSDHRHLALYARSVPAYEVGGDFYTYISLDDTRVAVAIGDISGKGVGAALMMALASSTVEAHGRTMSQPQQLLAELNQQLSSRLKANRMNAALLYTIIDLERQTLTVANAGMICPMVVRGGQVITVEAYGLPLGTMATAKYVETMIELQPGDMVVLASDGVVEAHGPEGELFGFDRLEQALGLSTSVMRPDQVVDDMMDRVTAFMAGAEQHDDMTLVVIQPNLTPISPEPSYLEQQEVVI